MGFTNWQERAEKAEEVPALTGASFVGAGGYNADKVDADVKNRRSAGVLGRLWSG